MLTALEQELHPVVNHIISAHVQFWFQKECAAGKLLPLRWDKPPKKKNQNKGYWLFLLHILFPGMRTGFLTPQEVGRQSSHGVWQSQASPFPPWVCLSVIIPGPQLVNTDGDPTEAPHISINECITILFLKGGWYMRLGLISELSCSRYEASLWSVESFPFADCFILIAGKSNLTLAKTCCSWYRNPMCYTRNNLEN